MKRIKAYLYRLGVLTRMICEARMLGWEAAEMVNGYKRQLEDSLDREVELSGQFARLHSAVRTVCPLDMFWEVMKKFHESGEAE